MKTSVVGFPRIGEQRELKKILEAYWSKKADFSEVESVAKDLRARHWGYQKDAGVDLISVNDFSLYDNMLDMMQVLGAIPARFRDLSGEYRYFSMARGNETSTAMEMTKWFNTNYHYIVPELSLEDEYKLDVSSIKSQYDEAKGLGINAKINLIGPVTFLALAKRTDGGDTLELFPKILEVYKQLVNEISSFDDEVIIDFHEPVFVQGYEKALLLLKEAYNTLSASNVKIIVTTFFEHSNEATKVLLTTPIYALGLDFVDGSKNMDSLEDIAKSGKKLFAGLISGRNIWINDLEASASKLDEMTKIISKDNLIISTSCSLLHTPFTLEYESNFDKDIKSWLAYAKEKLNEVSILSKMFFSNDFNSANNVLLQANIQAVANRKKSSKVHNETVKQRVKNLVVDRDTPYDQRIKAQREAFKYPDLATTTIGSFPQTAEVRATRREFKKGNIDEGVYESKMKELILDCIKFQEDIDLDVLVHGEFERNDMVEYFGEQMDGFAFSQNGWVQSYGSRCVKPPVIYGDVSRENPMTVKWSSFANDNTKKIMKGMLTGPVTILNWSFVRDDQARSDTSYQIAVAISDEVKDLESAGVTMIQVDEAAFKEGYPLRAENIGEYERWAVESFKATVAPAKATTQIHTHMCYSEFNDIIKTIEDMDADVISIETARSGNELLKIFKSVGYKQEVGPGIYDIHSPRVPSVDEMVKQIEALMEVLPKTQLWINPDCGLKTRKWEEVKPSLRNMVEAVKVVRNK